MRPLEWVALLLVVGLATSAAGQEASCPAGRSRHGDVGLRGLRCEGPAASCAINLSSSDGYRHEFAVEPVVTSTDRGSSSVRDLREGDVLVAVDDLLITTIEGGRHLANLEIDREVRLLVRRRGEMVTLRLRTDAGCGIVSLSVSP